MMEFRMSLGVLGAKSCDFIFRRIFELIDGNKNMKVIQINIIHRYLSTNTYNSLIWLIMEQTKTS